MSTDEFEDDGVEIRRKKPVRLCKNGQPDRRSPPREHQFKRGKSGNPEGARAHKSPRRPRSSRDTLEELLAKEVILPNGEIMTYDGVITLQQITAASKGSTPAYKAIQQARARGGPSPEPETPEEQQTRLQFLAMLGRLSSDIQHLKKEGLLGPGEGLTLAPWIYEARRQRVAAGLEPPSAMDLFEEKKRRHEAEEAAKAEAEKENGSKPKRD